MPAASRSSAVARTWRALSPEQRVAGIGAVLLIVSTFGPFSFVEAGILLVALAVLLLLKKRAEGRVFHLPFGDGTVIALAGLWCGFLIMVRLLDRPLGQNLLALACAAILLAAGVRERAKRPADDLPRERERAAGHGPVDWLAEEAAAGEARAPGRRAPAQRGRRRGRSSRSPGGGEAATERLERESVNPPPDREPPTRPLGREARARRRAEDAATRPLEDDAATRPLPEDPPEMRLPEER